jgi:hypothetical protein
VDPVQYKGPPSFLAACLAAAGGHVVASFVIGVVMVPLALATSSAVALAPSPSPPNLRLLLSWLIVLATQPFIAAWLAQRGLDLFDAGTVTYLRALGGMILLLVVTTGSALVLPAEAALPLLGYVWAGAPAAALVLATRRAAPAAGR